MFSHGFPATRDFERTRKRWSTLLVLAAVAATGACEPASAEHVALGGKLTFAPGATALAAPQRQTLDEMQRRRSPLCVVLGVRRSDGPVTELTALETARVDYVTQLFSIRDVTVLASGTGWRQPEEVVDPAWAHTLWWLQARCPGVPEPTRDWTQPQP